MIDISRALGISGWMPEGELAWLAEYALSANTIVEIGSYRGRSTRALADHCAGIVYAIDSWLDEEGCPPGYGQRAYEGFCSNLADHIDSGRVVVMRGKSRDQILPFLARIGRTVDLAFIDGDHSYDGCREDIDLCLGLMVRGGVLAGHDYNTIERHAGVRRAVDEMFGMRVQLRHSIWWVQL
jgi:predicted O-methyltransferase YrrM